MISVAELLAGARSCKRIQWHHQGRNRAGLDCVGLPILVLSEAGVLPRGDLRRVPVYGTEPTPLLKETVARWCRSMEAAPGALVLIRWRPGEDPAHVAILAGATIIHTHRKSAGVVEEPYAGRWTKLTDSTWAMPGVAYPAEAR